MHALGQVVSFDSATRLSPQELTKALNAELPEDMHVFEVERAPDGFHAQKDAVRKRYRYLLEDGRTRDLFARNYLWHIFQRLDVEAMQAGREYAPRHARLHQLRDERLIAVDDGIAPFSTCSSNARASELTDRIAIEVEADGFLYNMVRNIVGTLVQVGKGKEAIDWPAKVLELRDRRKAGHDRAGQGLYLGGGGIRRESNAECGVRNAEWMQTTTTSSSRVRQLHWNSTRTILLYSAFRIPNSALPPMRIAHIITRMIIGGAQENTLYNCEDLIRLFGDDVLLITGPALGPEGDLLEQGRGGGVPIAVIPSLRRAIDPLRDSTSYFALKRAIREFQARCRAYAQRQGRLPRPAGGVGRCACRRSFIRFMARRFIPIKARRARNLFRWCERHAARHCHALISVADAMTDLMVDAGVAPREKFTHDLQRHGCRAVSASRRASRGHAAATWLSAAARRHRQNRPAVSSQRARGRDSRRSARSSRPIDNVRFLFIGDGILRETAAEANRCRRTDAAFSFRRARAAGRDSAN